MSVMVGEIVAFSHQFGESLEQGISLVDSLLTLAQQQSNGSMKQVILEVREKVLKGFPLSWAMAEHPDVFDNNYIAMVRRGEKAGQLDLVLKEFANTSNRHRRNAVR